MNVCVFWHSFRLWLCLFYHQGYLVVSVACLKPTPLALLPSFLFSLCTHTPPLPPPHTSYHHHHLQQRRHHLFILCSGDQTFEERRNTCCLSFSLLQLSANTHTRIYLRVFFSLSSLKIISTSIAFLSSIYNLDLIYNII